MAGTTGRPQVSIRGEDDDDVDDVDDDDDNNDDDDDDDDDDICLGDYRNLVDVNFCCAMGPPGGGRNPITARLQRHFNLLAYTEMEDPSKKKIFGTILQSWMRKLFINSQKSCFVSST